ncbi:hypothetical protein DMUE_1506 [Dictyocoela muelleri]|nr:hypothetical protein DMUE_1506 [Dictyocoela muelleri]
MTFSKNEIDFWKTRLRKRQRLERRKFNDCREFHYEVLETPQADFGLKVKSGCGEMEIFLRFFESDNVFSKLEIESQTLIKETIYKNNNFLFLKEEINREIEDFGITIETIFYKNDGNEFGMFYNGLNYIFKNIEIPVIDDEGNICDKNLSIELPCPETIGIFKGMKIIDPNYIEYEICTSIIHILRKNNTVKKIFIEKSEGMSVDQIIEAVF